MFNKVYEKVKKFILENYKFLIVLIFLIFLFYYELPFVIYKSGGTINLENRIIIDKDYEENGSLSMSYVTTVKGTIPFILLSYILPDWDLYPLEEDYDEMISVGKEYLNEGIDNAIISAFNASTYNITILKENNIINYIGEKANTNLLVGDKIVSINGNNIDSFKVLREYLNTLGENDKIDIKVIHDNKEYDRHAYLYRDTDDTLKIGVGIKTTYDYETEIPVSVKMKNNESGSSGGFMMSLAIYNALTDEDITKGLNIVGTGTISSDGVVGEIGGVKYKILAANKAHADIFFCPEENYEEAIEVKNRRNLSVNVVKIHTLEEAINYLENYN